MIAPFFDRLAVLVVDDRRDCADSLAELLRAYGHEARAAYTSAEAMIAADSFPADVVVMDIGMPGMDGYELARKLCERLAYRPILVAVTGYGNLEERSRREGFDHHFLKPVAPAELVSAITSHAEQRHRFVCNHSAAMNS
jgi:CheY-like chemotaxis protein